jgi:uncharacterized membrane protein YphA (DoxX/SURF4 family)
MLSVFPEFLNYSLLGIFLIRAVVGISIFILSINVFKNRTKISKVISKKGYAFSNFFITSISVTGLLSGLFLMAGILTQISALVIAYILLNLLLIDPKGELLKQSKTFYISMIVICISFLFLGPGFFGIDIPL